MFDIWQSGTTGQVRGVSDAPTIDIPRVTGITQLNSYYQSVLGAPAARSLQGPSNAVTVAGELNAYLGASTSAGTMSQAYPSSRVAIGHVGTPVAAANTADAGVSASEDLNLCGLLPATASVRNQAQAGDWASLAAWKVAPQAAAGKSPGSRQLVAQRSVDGDLDRYAAEYQASRSTAQSSTAIPRVSSQQVAHFMDHSDYSHSVDPRTASGERAEDVPARQVADLVGGFTRLSS